MKNRKLKVYETEYQTNNPNGFWYCSKRVFLSLRFDCRENGYKNVVLNQEVKCRFNTNRVNDNYFRVISRDIL